MEKRRRGRPKKDDNFITHVTLRCTEAEKEMLIELAREKKMSRGAMFRLWINYLNSNPMALPSHEKQVITEKPKRREISLFWGLISIR
jgi:hypothetical protein